MRPFSNHAKLFAQHSANIAFRLLLALTIVFAAATVIPAAVYILPFALCLAVVIYALTHLFNGKRSRIRSTSLAAAVTQADIFNPSQLQISAIVMTAIYQHYGWSQDAAGKWIQVEGAREIPKMLDKLRITRRDLWQFAYLTPGQDTFRFFQKIDNSNLKEVNLQATKMYVLFGIIGELATGASAADTIDILNFGAPVAGTDEEVLNGSFNLKINTIQEVDGSQVKSAFVNDDAVKNYFRFPKPIVLEPGNSMDLQLVLCKAYAAGVHKYQRFTVLAFELTK